MRFCLALLAMLAWLPARGDVGAANPGAAAHDPRVDLLMERSGLLHTLRQVRPGVLSGMREGQGDLPMAVSRAMAQSAERAFQSERMIAEVRAHLAANLAADDVSAVLEWLDTPLGRHVTQLENAAATPEAQARLQAYAHALGEDPPTPERLSLCQRLDQVTHASELMGQLLEAAMLAGAAGANAAQPMERQVPPEVLRRMLQQQFGAQLGQVQQLVVLTQLFTYDALSDAELRQYLDFLQTPAGTRYLGESGAALRQSIIDALGRFMQYLPAAIRASEGVIGI
jgi:hypothetical protein